MNQDVERRLWCDVYRDALSRDPEYPERRANAAVHAYREAFPSSCADLPAESFAPTPDRPIGTLPAFPEDETPEAIAARVLANVDGGTWFRPGEP